MKVQVHKDLRDGKDIWLGVVPVAAPDTIWLQGTKLVTVNPERVVILGLEGRLLSPERFQICICSCNKGAVKRAGEINLADADKYGIEILASRTVARIE